MNRFSWTAKTTRRTTTPAQWVRLLTCVVLCGGLFTIFFGEWFGELQFLSGAVIGVIPWLAIEILGLITADARRARRGV